MKKLIVLFALLLMMVTPVHADGPVITENAKLIIYERYVNEKTYERIGSTSIWKANEEYANLIQEGWAKEVPDQTIEIRREN